MTTTTPRYLEFFRDLLEGHDGHREKTDAYCLDARMRAAAGDPKLGEICRLWYRTRGAQPQEVLLAILKHKNLVVLFKQPIDLDHHSPYTRMVGIRELLTARYGAEVISRRHDDRFVYRWQEPPGFQPGPFFNRLRDTRKLPGQIQFDETNLNFDPRPRILPDIATLVGISYQHILRESRKPGFPQPIATKQPGTGYRLFDPRDVIGWLKQNSYKPRDYAERKSR